MTIITTTKPTFLQNQKHSNSNLSLEKGSFSTLASKCEIWEFNTRQLYLIDMKKNSRYLYIFYVLNSSQIYLVSIFVSFLPLRYSSHKFRFRLVSVFSATWFHQRKLVELKLELITNWNLWCSYSESLKVNLEGRVKNFVYLALSPSLLYVFSLTLLKFKSPPPLRENVH